jgi:hypothetical protein
MNVRFAIPLVLVAMAACEGKLTGPEAQSAAREYQSKTVAEDKKPLAFVDGIEVPVDSLRSFTVGKIESVEVLKGRRAIELHGARGVNGAIYVRTKR